MGAAACGPGDAGQAGHMGTTLGREGTWALRWAGRAHGHYAEATDVLAHSSSGLGKASRHATGQKPPGAPIVAAARGSVFRRRRLLPGWQLTLGVLQDISASLLGPVCLPPAAGLIQHSHWVRLAAAMNKQLKRFQATQSLCCNRSTHWDAFGCAQASQAAWLPLPLCCGLAL